jgi:hypothetical protein
LGTRAFRLASIAFRDCAFPGRFFGTVTLAGCFLGEGLFGLAAVTRFGRATVEFFFFATTFLIGRFVSFLLAAAFLPFLAG